MQQNPVDLKILIEKYLLDQCREDEYDILLACLNTPEGVRVMEEMMDNEAVLLLRSRLGMDPEISDRMFSRLKAQIQFAETTHTQTKSIPFYRNAGWRIAASLTGILFLAAMGWLLFLKQSPTQTFTTDAGQKRTVILEDGSRVTLNANSSVSFDNSGSSRKIQLDGEAYFDIAHDPSRPFFVKTSRIEIKVLGTAFNVKSYPGEETVEATLIRGKVLIKNLEDRSGQQKEIELKPNEQAVFKKQSASLDKVTPPVLPKETVWHRGNLMFEEESIRVILPELEKWYHVKIIADEQSLDCSFSMNIGEESLADLLRFFEATTSVRALQKGKEIRLEGNLCN